MKECKRWVIQNYAVVEREGYAYSNIEYFEYYDEIRGHVMIDKEDVFTTREEAIEEAKKIRDNEVEKLQAKIEKLKSIKI